MFNRIRFKRYYGKFKKEHYTLSDGWSVSLKDISRLLLRLPVNIVSGFGQEQIRYLNQFTAKAYYPNVIELLTHCRAATAAMVDDVYIDEDPGEEMSVQMDRWLQPTAQACNFNLLVSDLAIALRDYVDAYDNVKPDKTGYYSRKTMHITHDLFSLVEILSELVLWDRS